MPLSLMRKQQDSGAAMPQTARPSEDTDLQDAGTEFERSPRPGAMVLADSFAALAVEIAQTAQSA